MNNEGSLYVVRLNKGEPHEPEFAVRFAPNDGAAGKLTAPRKFLGEESLWAFLAFSLSLGSKQVEAALSDLHETGSAEIESLDISDDDLRRFKLV
jgi:hypothetical protein